MNTTIKQEKPSDYKAIAQIIEEAFRDEPYSDHNEQLLVEKLRMSKDFIPELSLIAEQNGEIIGHILLTKIKIINKSKTFDSLALAPVSVKPGFQKKGIGGMLITESHKKAKILGHRSIVLLGHENYYPRFGYKLASNFGIKIPFDAPDENCMAIELVENALKSVSGIVQYPKAFHD